MVKRILSALYFEIKMMQNAQNELMETQMEQNISLNKCTHGLFMSKYTAQQAVGTIFRSCLTNELIFQNCVNYETIVGTIYLLYCILYYSR